MKPLQKKLVGFSLPLIIAILAINVLGQTASTAVADDRVSKHHRQAATRKEIKGCENKSEEKVKAEAQGCGLVSALVSALTQGAAGDGLQYARRHETTTNIAEDTGVGDVEHSGNQAANENGFERAASHYSQPQRTQRRKHNSERVTFVRTGGRSSYLQTSPVFSVSSVVNCRAISF